MQAFLVYTLHTAMQCLRRSYAVSAKTPLILGNKRKTNAASC